MKFKKVFLDNDVIILSLFVDICFFKDFYFIKEWRGNIYFKDFRLIVWELFILRISWKCMRIICIWN